MLVEIDSAIVNLLKAQGLAAYSWSGKIEDLFSKPKYIPTIRTVIENALFGEPTNIEGTSLKLTITYSLILFFRNLREDASGAYPLIETIISTLSNKDVRGFFAVPKDITLLYQDAGEFVYKISFQLTGLFSVPEPEVV